MLSYIPTYYVLYDLSSRPWSKADVARRQLENLSASMALCFRDYLFMASLGEARHAHNKIGRGFDNIDGKSRDAVYEKSNRYGPTPENIAVLVELLDSPVWGEKPGYGGPRWARLAEMSGRYGSISDVLYVDAVVNAQHNGGTVFNKSEAAGYMDIDFEISLSSLQSFLNYRRSAPDFLKEFHKYMSSVSLSAGKLIIAHLSETGIGPDISKLRPLPDKTYSPVQWQNNPLPKITTTLSYKTCDNCGKKTKTIKKCKTCGNQVCASCYNREAAACHACANKNKRCPICLMELILGQTYETECGAHIHKVCASYHNAHCITCAQEPEHDDEFIECYLCHKPLFEDALENWHGPSTIQRCHQYCYHLGPKAYGGDKTSSLNKFNQIAHLCAVCRTPVLKETIYTPPPSGCQHYEHSDVFHPWCYSMHEAVCETAVHYCHCSECQTAQQKWSEKYHEQAQEQKSEG